MTPPSYVADYCRAPLPPEPPKAVPFGVNPRPLLNEWEAPLVYGAKSQKDYRRAFLKRPLGFQVYKNTVKTIRHFEFKGKLPKPKQFGAKIDSFSPRSRRALRLRAVDAFPALTSQFVLTYPAEFPQDGKESKDQLKSFLDSFRKKFKGVPYLWVLEFQRRGAPHYHLFTSLDVTEENRLWLARTWVRVACGGSPEALRFHSHERNFIPWDMGNGAYVCKYLDKSNQKDVPEGYTDVGRFWGSSRGLVPKPVWLDAEQMMAAFQDTALNACTRTVRAMVKYYQNVTSHWIKEEGNDGNKYLSHRQRKGRNYHGASIYSFHVINGKQIFLQCYEWFDRCEKGKKTFKQWSREV